MNPIKTVGSIATTFEKGLAQPTRKLSKKQFYQGVDDVVEFVGGKFSVLERKLMSQIKGGEVETARIIDNNGNFVPEIKFIGDKFGVRLDPEMIMRPDLIKKIKDSTYIHNHPFETPLSANDIYVMAQLGIKKMVTVTSGGGFSYIKRIKPIKPEQEKLINKAAGSLIGKENQQIKKLSLIKITDQEKMQLLNNWRIKEIQKFADEFGFEFKNKLGVLKLKEGQIPKNFFKASLGDKFKYLINKIKGKEKVV